MIDKLTIIVKMKIKQNRVCLDSDFFVFLGFLECCFYLLSLFLYKMSPFFTINTRFLSLINAETQSFQVTLADVFKTLCWTTVVMFADYQLAIQQRFWDSLLTNPKSLTEPASWLRVKYIVGWDQYVSTLPCWWSFNHPILGT